MESLSHATGNAEVGRVDPAGNAEGVTAGEVICGRVGAVIATEVVIPEHGVETAVTLSNIEVADSRMPNVQLSHVRSIAYFLFG
jgi:hypothetical protein